MAILLTITLILICIFISLNFVRIGFEGLTEMVSAIQKWNEKQNEPKSIDQDGGGDGKL